MAELIEREDILPEPGGILDQVEKRILDLGGQKRQQGEDNPGCHMEHHFVPGLYAREMHLPQGMVNVSETHLSEHLFVVSLGHVMVYQEKEERWVEIQAPYTGVTKPGARRFVIALADTIWTTFHVTDKTDIAEIEREILLQRKNPLLGEEHA